MKLDQHLDLLESTAETLSTLSFSHSRAFVNSLLSRTEITSVIRDAEPHERALFQTSSKGSPKKIKISGQMNEVLKSRDAELGTLLIAAEKLLKLYPVDGVQDRIDMMRHKTSILTQTINELESEVEIQRQQLDKLAIGRDCDDDMADENAAVQTVVTDEMIANAEEEIKHLEASIERKQKR